MKITKSQLKQLIVEEMAILNEGDWYSDEHETMADRKFADRPGMLDEPDPRDIQLLQAIKEVLESSGRRVGTWGLSKELRRLAEVVAKNPEFDVEEPEMSDEDAFELPPVTGGRLRRMRQIAKRKGEEF